MATTEATINDALAEVLRATRRVWATSISSENTGQLKGSGARPDILVSEPNVSPVVLETEVLPAVTVEADAKSRLGAKLRRTGGTILSSIAIRLPVELRDAGGQALRTRLAATRDLEFALFTGTSPSSVTRWPSSGWIRGSVADLSLLVQSASVPPEVIDQAADQLVAGVSEVAGLLAEMSTTHPGAIEKICKELRQDDSEQTRRMAATILANAFVFHETLANGPGPLADVKSLAELKVASSPSKQALLSEWAKILKVNYWPIFDIARRILEVVPASDAKPLVQRLAETAERLLETRLMRSHDLTGAVFQRLIVDRKFLAAYYTTPASAALLVGLALPMDAPPPSGADWRNPDALLAMRIADFACGTGTLVSTAYQRVGQLHELSGGDAAALHPAMMADVLIGCDVLPAAAHLTASMLAGAHPTVSYEKSAIMTVAYGVQDGGHVTLGSLDLLDPQGRLSVLAVTAKAAEGMGEREREIWSALPHATFDFVVMNPPFTRPTGHEGKKIGVPNPMFAAFGFTAAEQKLMSAMTAKLTKGTSAHQNAGEASIFLVLAHRKLKREGRLALVMPLSLMLGESWSKSRELLVKGYSDIVVVSIAAAEGKELSFSADTGMGECLVVATKTGRQSKRATFVVLNESPRYPIFGAQAAREIVRVVRSGEVRKLEDGPVGGTAITFGDEVVGQVLDAPLPKDPQGPWNLSRISDLALAQTAYQLAGAGRLWLPGTDQRDARPIPVTTVGQLGTIGPYHMDVSGNTADGGIRGPFDIRAVKPDSAPTYPVLWSHDADRERTLAFEHDHEGIPRRAKASKDQAAVDSKVKEVWASASHCHFNRDFRFNSQSTSIQYTPRLAIGGRAWTSIKLKTVEMEKALVVWGNTTLGLLLYWWHANKQQDGRGSIGVSALDSLPVIDVKALTARQLAAASKLFDDMCGVALKTLSELEDDLNRAELDRRFMTEVLGLPPDFVAEGGPLELLRRKLTREPSIQG